MIAVKVFMKVTGEPLKRTPVALRMDIDSSETEPVFTDRSGVANFPLEPGTGKVLVSGIERYHGRLDGEVPIGLWSITQSSDDSAGAPGGLTAGSNAYPSMTTRSIHLGDREILTDSEGYLVQPGDWSEAFANAQAALEGLDLNKEHWEVIRYLRAHYAKSATQASVRDMIKHFRGIWGTEKGSSRYLHKLFPRGGPQKQGNRLAGLLRTKGEH